MGLFLNSLALCALYTTLSTQFGSRVCYYIGQNTTVPILMNLIGIPQYQTLLRSYANLRFIVQANRVTSTTRYLFLEYTFQSLLWGARNVLDGVIGYESKSFVNDFLNTELMSGVILNDTSDTPDPENIRATRTKEYCITNKTGPYETVVEGIVSFNIFRRAAKSKETLVLYVNALRLPMGEQAHVLAFERMTFSPLGLGAYKIMQLPVHCGNEYVIFENSFLKDPIFVYLLRHLKDSPLRDLFEFEEETSDNNSEEEEEEDTIVIVN